MAGEPFEQTTFAELISEGALEIGDGYRAKNEELGGNGLIFLRAGHVSDTHIDFEGVERFHSELEPRVRSKLAQPGDAIVTTKGNSTGRTAYVSPSMPPFVYSPHLSYWRSRNVNRIEGGFLRYWSKGREFTDQLAGMQASTDMAPYLSLIDQKRLRISLPAIVEQRAIAHILGTLDEKIELNRRMSATLEAMARALFKAWFVDFEPVRAKAEGRDLVLPPHSAALFPDRVVETDEGEVPEGWEVKPLADCLEVVRGLSYKGSGLSERGAPMHNLNSIYEGGGYKHAGLKRYDGDYKAHHVARAGDVIVANTEQGHQRLLIGYAAIVPNCFGEESLFSHHIYRVRPKRGSRFTPDYLCHLLNTSVMHDVVSGYANGTTVNMLPIDGLQSPQIVVPPAGVISAFNVNAESARLRQEEMVQESGTLAALRDRLLPKLICGELRVTDAETFLERVL